MFILPGFVVLELAFPTLARTLDPLERGTLFLGLSMGVWTLIAAVAYRVQMPSDMVINGVLVGDTLGLAALFVVWSRYENATPSPKGKSQFDSIDFQYVISLVVVLLIIAIVVGLSTEYQRYDFDSSTHLAGFHKIADSARIIGGNPFQGPQYSYITHYIANPWYLAFGLSARLAHTSVTWLYVYLAALLSPLFFLGVYSLIKVLIRERWIAILGTLLMVGPWVAEKALAWGPPMGTFYLQFLPYPETCAQLILFPLWLNYCLRYVYSQTLAHWAVTALLAVAAMGVHPENLFLIPYSIGIVFIVSILYPASRPNWGRMVGLGVFIVISAAVIAYLIVNPLGKDYLKDTWVVFDKEDVLRQFLRNAWVINPDLYAVHPKFLITLDNIKNTLGCVVTTLFIWFRPSLSVAKKEGRWLPVISLTTSPSVSSRHLALTVAAVFAGPYLILYNPIMAPLTANLLGSVLPLRLMAPFYEVLALACNYGAIASIFIMFLWDNVLNEYGKKGKTVLLAIVVIGGVVIPLGRPDVSSMIWRIIDRDAVTVSILDLEDDPLYRKLSTHEPGVVAIDKERAEYLVMSTPHHVISCTRMIEERQLDNRRIVNFSVSLEEIKDLLRRYNCRYIVVPLDTSVVSNGDFSTGIAFWDPVVSSVIAAIPGGQSGNCLQLKKKRGFGVIYKFFKLFPFGNYLERVERKYNSQITYQNITCNVGKMYELKGYVKSGTSGDELFALQIFQYNVAGTGESAIRGTTTDSWVEYSTRFRADYPELSVVLRKHSATPGTMLFDTISCREVVLRRAGRIEKQGVIGGEKGEDDEFVPYGALQRFREHPEIFEEILTLDKDAVFKVKDVGGL